MDNTFTLVCSCTHLHFSRGSKSHATPNNLPLKIWIKFKEVKGDLKKSGNNHIYPVLLLLHPYSGHSSNSKKLVKIAQNYNPSVLLHPFTFWKGWKKNLASSFTNLRTWLDILIFPALDNQMMMAWGVNSMTFNCLHSGCMTSSSSSQWCLRWWHDSKL